MRVIILAQHVRNAEEEVAQKRRWMGVSSDDTRRRIFYHVHEVPLIGEVADA